MVHQMMRREPRYLFSPGKSDTMSESAEEFMSDPRGDGLAIRLHSRRIRIPPHAGARYRRRFLRMYPWYGRHIAEYRPVVSPPEE